MKYKYQYEYEYEAWNQVGTISVVQAEKMGSRVKAVRKEGKVGSSTILIV